MSIETERLTREFESTDELAAQVNSLAEQYQPLLYEKGVHWTPLKVAELDDSSLNAHRLLVKNEGAQPTESYKLRGATVAVDAAVQQAELRGEQLDFAVCASNGNHGEAVAYAAQRAELKGAVVEMTVYSDEARRNRVRTAGAHVHHYHPNLESALAAAQLADTFYGQAFIPPFNSEFTMAGQGSIALETLAELHDLQDAGEIDLLNNPMVVLYPVGGGGLISGNAAVFEAARRRGEIGNNLKVLGVQMEGADTAARKRYGMEPLTAETLDTSCQSTALLETGDLTQTIMNDEKYVADILVVSKLEVGEAMMLLEKWYGQTEPAAALSIAGSLKLARMREAAGETEQLTMIALRSGNGNVTQPLYEEYVLPAQQAAFARLSAEQLDQDESGEMFSRPPTFTSSVGHACLSGATRRQGLMGAANRKTA